MVSYIFKFQDAVNSVNLTEEEDGSTETKEDFDSKEEKLHSVPFELAAAVSIIEHQRPLVFSDEKVDNHSFEISSPPPNC